VILPQVFETPAPASVAPAHRDDVTIAAACWKLVQEISGDGLYSVEVWTDRDTEPRACVTVFGPWHDADSRLFRAESHFAAIAAAAEAVRSDRTTLPQCSIALAGLVEAARVAQCACTPKQREAGHKSGCWFPEFQARLRVASEAVRKGAPR